MMNKIQQQLERQRQQYQRLEKARQQHKQCVEQLYLTLIEWLSDFLSTKERLDIKTFREMRLSLSEHTAVILRFSPSFSISSPSTTVLLTLFELESPKLQTHCLLSWQERQAQWRILRLKRKNHPLKLPSIWYQRAWQKASLESLLIDFIDTSAL